MPGRTYLTFFTIQFFGPKGLLSLLPNPLRLIGWVSFLLSLGCGTDLYWAKPDAVEGEFEQDLRSCREMLINEIQYSETSLNPLSRGITDEALANCLNGKGWFLAEKP